MGRLFNNKKKKVLLHRWLGLRPVDFVRAAERRAAILLRQLDKPSRAQRHHPLSPIPHPLPYP